MNWTTEQIEHYILGTLPVDELSKFEKELKENIALRDELSLYTDLIRGIQRMALKEELDHIHKKQNRKGGKGLAFLIIVLVGIGFGAYNYHSQSNSELTPSSPTQESEVVMDTSISHQHIKADDPDTVSETRNIITIVSDTTSSFQISYDTIRVVETTIEVDSVAFPSKKIIINDEDLLIDIEQDVEEIEAEPIPLDTISTSKFSL